MSNTLMPMSCTITLNDLVIALKEQYDKCDRPQEKPGDHPIARETSLDVRADSGGDCKKRRRNEKPRDLRE
jgi:hypothetical protein